MDDRIVSYLMLTVLNKSRRSVEERMRELNINQQQAGMIAYIAEHEEQGLIQKDLAEAFHRRSASITSMLQGLEKKGYIERYIPAENERQKRIVALSKGKELVEEINRIFREAEENLVQGLEKSEQEELIRLLRKMADAM